MSHQIGGHKCAIAVSADGNAVAIGHTFGYSEIDCRLCGVGNLFDKRVVHDFRFAHDRHGRIV